MNKLLAPFLLLPALFAGCRPAPPTDPLEAWRAGSLAGWDLLLVTLDTTRADHLGAYGYPAAETPNLDRLARSGVRFTDAVSAVPLTLPSHATIFTGLYPPAHGVRNNAEFHLGPTPSTLAEKLAGAGYDTAGFVSAFVLDARYGIGRGFATYDDRVEPVAGPTFAAGTLERKAPATTDAYLAWLAARPKDARLFAWIHYFDAHGPYEPPPELAARFAERPYDGEIALVDRELGRALAALEAAGRRDRTLVVVCGDHGEGLGDHGEATHGQFLYDSTTRVPLIVAAPGVLAAGLVDGRVVATADLLPSLLELFGITDGEKRDGQSWVGRPPEAARAVYLETLAPYQDFGWAPLFALRSLRHKAILAPRRELYDLADDPGEEKSLEPASGAAAGEGSRLFARLEAELGASPALGASRPGEVSDEERAQLQALGYLGGAGPAGGENPAALADPKDRIAVANALIDANAAMAAGRLDQAERFLRQAAAAAPGDRSVLYAHGKLMLRLGRTAEAEASFRALSAHKPRADVSILLAQMALAAGREGEAETRLAEAEKLDPRHGGVFIARGDLWVRRGRPDQAAEQYRKALELDPYRSAGMAKARLESLAKARNGS